MRTVCSGGRAQPTGTPNGAERKSPRSRPFGGLPSSLLLTAHCLACFRLSSVLSEKYIFPLKGPGKPSTRKADIPPGLVMKMTQGRHCEWRETCVRPLKVGGDVSRLGHRLKVLLKCVQSQWRHRTKQWPPSVQGSLWQHLYKLAAESPGQLREVVQPAQGHTARG